MAKVLYFDCFSGCSGDMILGALLDAGVSLEKLREGLKDLNIGSFQLNALKVKRAGIQALKFEVISDQRAYQGHRGLHDIIDIINSSGLPEKVKNRSCAVFRRLGQAEARIHGVPLEEIHFHELGALDTIIDIAGTSYALELLGIEKCYSSPLPAGGGNIATQHGILPAPAPATLQLLAEVKAPIVQNPGTSRTPGELVTPTGAALITSLASFGRPEMQITGIGYGAGSRDIQEFPNILRVWLGETAEDTGDEDLVLLETNIDDMNPQIFGFLLERLLAEKAADVWFTPIQMKKNRPGIMLSVLAHRADENKLAGIIMRETTTLGIRVSNISRHIAQREIFEFDSSLGRTRVKIKRSPEFTGISPEYEDCRRISLEKQLPLQEVIRIIESEARLRIDGKK
ncbi:MAG: nickel pincer cofactor biosynthesis protein LarC [Dehalococcoidales bacterium]|jgi:uncharacterized protein (TIGR00299 family) protein|nr:nickel pincer cofactor biosynthesis protein LarC [Dehalococcoidales bacterium]